MTFASAECFTHCRIGMEIHRLSAPYNLNPLPVRVLFTGFFPSPETAEKILKIKLPSPLKTVKGVKIYDEEGDLKAAKLLAEGIKELFNPEIAIGSSAGIGRGAVVVIFKNKTYFLRSKVNANFLTSPTREIERRSNSAVELTVKALLSLIKSGKIPPYLETLNG